MTTKLHEVTAEVPVEEAGASNGLLSLDDILGIDDVTYETVAVPEWGGREVRLVSLSGEERNRIAVAMRAHAKKLRSEEEAAIYFQARIILASMVDGEGTHIGDQSQAPALMKKNGAALTRLFTVAQRLSGIGQDEEDEVIDDLKTTPSGDTGSD
jgi:hypothetical protein